MTLMRSPRGEEVDILAAGVSAMSRLGWEKVEAVKEDVEPTPARRGRSTRRK